MTRAASSPRSPQPRAEPGPLPPWLWLWAASLVALAPRLLGDAWGTAAAFRTWVVPPLGLEAWLAPILLFLLLLQNLPALVFLLGIASALVPRWRAPRLERRFALAPITGRGGALAEIEAFVREHAPRLELRANLRRMAPIAFVYPTGLRTARLAVMGGLVKLWRSDPAGARAVLLHEIAHQRQGDPAIIGIGSLLAPVLRLWPLAILAFAALILALDRLLRREIEAFRLAYAVLEETTVAAAPASVWPILFDYLADYVWILQPSPLGTVAGFALWSLGVVLLPTIAVWCAELAADRLTAANAEGRDALLRALDARGAETRRRRWTPSALGRGLIEAISHPPRWLRRLLVGRADAGIAALVIAVLFPLGFVLSALPILVASWMSASARGVTSLAAGPFVLGNLPFVLAGIRWQLATAAGLMLAWPLLAPWWARLVFGPPGVLPIRSMAAVALPGAAMLLGVLLLDPAAPPVLGERPPVVQPERGPGPGLRVLSKVLAHDEPVRIEIWGLDPTKQNWVAVAAHDWEPERYVDDPAYWTFTTGLAEGVIELDPREPGVWEARLYLDWPAGGTEIHGRALFIRDKPRP